MMDGTNLNVLQTSRQMLRAFGGLNEGYGCSEAEFSGEMNFSSRGYPALQTRKMRRNVRTVQGVNGMYHLNGLLICRGKTLEYTPDEEVRTGAVVLENVLTDDRKAMAGMGTKVLIWPDKHRRTDAPWRTVGDGREKRDRDPLRCRRPDIHPGRRRQDRTERAGGRTAVFEK